MGNIFIGLGEFHLENVLLGVVGQFLVKIGVRDIFVQNEIYRRAITDNKVMTGGDYILSRQGMQILFEVISSLRVSVFLMKNCQINHMGKQVIILLLSSKV